MTIEAATYISSLNASYPASGDPKSEGDDHIRLVKSTVKATFPNVSGAVTPTHTELNYVDGVTSAIQTQLDAKAALASPALTGTPTAPTATALTNSTQIATTAYTDAAVTALGATKANLASPALTGTPTAPTATAGTSTTQIATTEFVTATAFASALPAQTGNAGKFVTTDGTNASWAEGLPSQATHANKVLTTNGTSSSWTADWPGNTLTVAKGGTGLTTLTANNLIVGAGTSNVTFIAPSTSGNVLTSNGSTWASTAPVIPDGNLVYLSQVSAGGASTVSFTSSFSSTYDIYIVRATLLTSGNNAGMTVNITQTSPSASLTATGSITMPSGTGHSFEAKIIIVDSDSRAGVYVDAFGNVSGASSIVSTWTRSSGSAGRVDGVSFTGVGAITGTFKLYGVKKT